VKVYLRPKPKLRILNFDFDFSTLAIKGRGTNGNILSRHSVRKVIKKEEGVSTLGARGIWFDDTIKRLNSEERGQFLGDFKSDDKILTIMQSGYCKLVNYSLSTHFDENMILIKKYDPEEIITAIYFDNTIGKYYAKRFLVDNTEKKQSFIAKDNETRLIHLLPEQAPRIEITLEKKNKEKVKEIVELKNFITVKGYKAKGKRLYNGEIKKIKLLETESTAENNNTEIIPEVVSSPSGESLKEKVDITKIQKLDKSTDTKQEEKEVSSEDKSKKKDEKVDDRKDKPSDDVQQMTLDL